MARRKIGFWYRLCAVLLRPPLLALTKRDWRGAEHIPPTGGFVAVANHNTHVDPVTFAHYLFDNGRLPRFLAKSGLFRTPVIKHVVRGSGQIPVYRESRDAMLAYGAALDAVRAGECVVVYPEGTITRDPHLWPMVGKTGAARIALATGAPVIPFAQWGMHELLAPYGKRPHLFPRKTNRVLAGPPVDLSAYQGKPVTPELVRAATEDIMAAITALLVELRGEPAPERRFDPRDHGMTGYGQPRADAARASEAADQGKRQ